MRRLSQSKKQSSKGKKRQGLVRAEGKTCAGVVNESVGGFGEGVMQSQAFRADVTIGWLRRL
jgi:hypothetical protein